MHADDGYTKKSDKIEKLWHSVADKSISNQKGVSKQTVGLFLQISDVK